MTYEEPSGKKSEDREIEGSFTQWFNTHGYLQKKELQAWLAQNIDVLGKATANTQAGDGTDGGKSLKRSEPVLRADNKLPAASTISVSSGVETVPAPRSAKKGSAKKKA